MTIKQFQLTYNNLSWGLWSKFSGVCRNICQYSELVEKRAYFFCHQWVRPLSIDGSTVASDGPYILDGVVYSIVGSISISIPNDNDDDDGG